MNLNGIVSSFLPMYRVQSRHFEPVNIASFHTSIIEISGCLMSYLDFQFTVPANFLDITWIFPFRFFRTSCHHLGWFIWNVRTVTQRTKSECVYPTILCSTVWVSWRLISREWSGIGSSWWEKRKSVQSCNLYACTHFVENFWSIELL